MYPCPHWGPPDLGRGLDLRGLCSVQPGVVAELDSSYFSPVHDTSAICIPVTSSRIIHPGTQKEIEPVNSPLVLKLGKPKLRSLNAPPVQSSLGLDPAVLSRGGSLQSLQDISRWCTCGSPWDSPAFVAWGWPRLPGLSHLGCLWWVWWFVLPLHGSSGTVRRACPWVTCFPSCVLPDPQEGLSRSPIFSCFHRPASSLHGVAVCTRDAGKGFPGPEAATPSSPCLSPAPAGYDVSL